MPPTYSLYYWPIPFRGEFVRYVLAQAGASFDEPDTAALVALKSAPTEEQPVPFMGPPVLHDHDADFWLSQLPAILMYLGRKHDLLPGDPARDGLTLKVICDCNDVLEEITCNCGATMWTQAEWNRFAETRLPRWMEMFETLGRTHGLTRGSGYLLGTQDPTLADLATAALWFPMADTLPELGAMLAQRAPGVAALSRRIAALPDIAAIRSGRDAGPGSVYCGGEIEKSLRSVLAT